MPKNDIKQLKDELKSGAIEQAGWDELQVYEIHKYETDAVVITSQGSMKMAMREIFVQYNFRMKVFETFGVVLPKVKEDIYSSWLMIWSGPDRMKDMGAQFGTTLDKVKEMLEAYLETAEDADVGYLKKGVPVLIEDGYTAFKPLDFTIWLKKKYGAVYSETQAQAFIKELGCEPRRLGAGRIRAWAYKTVDGNHFASEPVDVRIEGIGRAPEIMNDDSAPIEEDVEF